LSFILYRSHVPQSLRFYVIDPPEYPSAPSSAPPLRDFYEDLACYDFTRPEARNVDQALNDVVIDQVYFPASLYATTHNFCLFFFKINASFLVQTIINSAPRKSVKLLPTTASFLLTIASYLGGFFSFVLVLARITAVFMNLPLLPIPTWIGGTSETSRSYLKLKDISATGCYISFIFIPCLAQQYLFLNSAATRRQTRAGRVLHHTGYNTTKTKHA